jgi:hypothetical protein
MELKNDNKVLIADNDDEDGSSSSKSFSLATLPKGFLSFLSANGVHPSVYGDAAMSSSIAGMSPGKRLPRFIRVNPRTPVTLEQLQLQLAPAIVEPTPLTHFYRLPAGDTPIASIDAYKKGQIYGMDLASAIAVLALDVKPAHHIVDICCAPGAKLCMLADIVCGQPSDPFTIKRGSVTGVDINTARLSSCRTVLRHYRVNRTRLYQCDGTTFNVPPPTTPNLPAPHVLQPGNGVIQSPIPWIAKSLISPSSSISSSLVTNTGSNSVPTPILPSTVAPTAVSIVSTTVTGGMDGNQGKRKGSRKDRKMAKRRRQNNNNNNNSDDDDNDNDDQPVIDAAGKYDRVSSLIRQFNSIYNGILL